MTDAPKLYKKITTRYYDVVVEGAHRHYAAMNANENYRNDLMYQISKGGKFVILEVQRDRWDYKLDGEPELEEIIVEAAKITDIKVCYEEKYVEVKG